MSERHMRVKGSTAGDGLRTVLGFFALAATVAGTGAWALVRLAGVIL